jgi:hypothetical protein
MYKPSPVLPEWRNGRAHRGAWKLRRLLDAQRKRLFTSTPDLNLRPTRSVHHPPAGLVHGFRTGPKVRPIYHYIPESIEAHLAIVFAEMAVNHNVEHQTGWGIDKFVRTNRRYRIVKTKAARESFINKWAELMCMPIRHDVEAARHALEDDAS